MGSSRHLSVWIAAPARVVYDFASDPTHLPQWAAGLAETTVERVDGHWFADSPMGRVRVDFTAPNDLGVLDHTVTLPSGEAVLNLFRVVPDRDGCEAVFTVRRRPAMTEEQFDQDCEAVAADLQTLRSVIEDR